MYTSAEYKVHFQSVREISVKIEILNTQDQIVDRIEGVAKDGSINVDANSALRRTCDLQLVLNNANLIPSPTSQIWLNKRFRLWIGVRSLTSGEILYFNQGIFVINNPSIDISIADKGLSIKGLDKCSLLNGDIAGQLDTGIQIPIGTPLHEAIRSTAALGGETRFLIETSPYVTPYTIEKNSGESLWDVIEELVSLYMDYQCCYDVNGFLAFNTIRAKPTDSIVWNFSDADQRVSANNEINFSNIKNHYKIYGRILENGTQVKAEKEIRNATSTSAFTIEKVGRRSFVETEDKYFTNEQCQQRLNYEEFLHTNFNERINVSCLPIYLLDVNKLVSLNSTEDNIIGTYCVDKITMPIKHDGLMSFSAYRVY